MQLHAQHKGQTPTATALPNGAIDFQGTQRDSPSEAASMARAKVIRTKPGQPYPATDGWAFWRATSPASAHVVHLGHFRQVYFTGRK